MSQSPSEISKIDFYVNKDGSFPVRVWLDSVPEEVRGKVLARINLLKTGGPTLDFPYTSQIEGKLREARLRVGKTRNRVLCFFDEAPTAILLHGFTKATASVEEADKKIGVSGWHGMRPNWQPRAFPNSQPFTSQGEKAQMKTEWDNYLDQQLTNPSARQAYEEETKVLSIGVELVKQRKRKGLTQSELARKIGTSTPQLSRTERRPENVNMRTLIRYAEAVGMNLDVRLVAKKHRRPSIPDSAIIVSASSASRLPSAPVPGAARP